MSTSIHEIMTGHTGVMHMPVWRKKGLPEAPKYYRTHRDIAPKVNRSTFWNVINEMRCVLHIETGVKNEDKIIRVADPEADGMGICWGCAKAANCPLEQIAAKHWSKEGSQPSSQARLF